MQKPTTSVMFVPATIRGCLTREVQEVEEKLQTETSWKCKLVEKPGILLLCMFQTRFDMSNGCPLGQLCKVCNNSGIDCANKGIVYKAWCKTCDALMGENTDATTVEDIYIGESFRVFRSRVIEHQINLLNIKKESFAVMHWMKRHPLDTTAPDIGFKKVSVHSDALSRQLKEALLIMEQGTMNKREEFSNNEVVRMESSTYT